MDEMINERVTQKENELHATYDEKIRNFEERWVIATRALHQRLEHVPGNKIFSVR